MIEINSISIGGIILLILLQIIVMGLLFIIDSRMCKRVAKALTVGGIQIAVVGGAAFFLLNYQCWWCVLLFIIVIVVVAAWWQIVHLRLPLNLYWWKLCLSLFGGIGLYVIVAWMLFAHVQQKYFLLIGSLLVGLLVIQKTSGAAIQTYNSCKLHTRDHFRYLLANGATNTEALMPTIRRTIHASLLPILRLMASPLSLGMFFLFGGMMMGGVPPLTACCLCLLIMIDALCATLLIVALFFFLCR